MIYLFKKIIVQTKNNCTKDKWHTYFFKIIEEGVNFELFSYLDILLKNIQYQFKSLKNLLIVCSHHPQCLFGQYAS